MYIFISCVCFYCTAVYCLFFYLYLFSYFSKLLKLRFLTQSTLHLLILLNSEAKIFNTLFYSLINPRRMRREGYCSCRVCLSVCLLFDNSLHEWLFASKTNTHIQRRMEVKKYVGFSLKLLRSRVMASFTHLE